MRQVFSSSILWPNNLFCKPVTKDGPSVPVPPRMQPSRLQTPLDRKQRDAPAALERVELSVVLKPRLQAPASKAWTGHDAQEAPRSCGCMIGSRVSQPGRRFLLAHPQPCLAFCGAPQGGGEVEAVRALIQDGKRLDFRYVWEGTSRGQEGV
ncbi:Hypothetical predicted protein [Marmota monax]|uniref:Uncharacterized protein n=1 Tax=Marmota monax TaxID=9995 RepID=A0A5E4A0U5_MARMO|nr:hypothetical protein GHT09_001175 [Marmota monax]VTJ50800.1 Hypothetical predicted protein [Marmota monax]